jgi:hypothetical protein
LRPRHRFERRSLVLAIWRTSVDSSMRRSGGHLGNETVILLHDAHSLHAKNGVALTLASRTPRRRALRLHARRKRTSAAVRYVRGSPSLNLMHMHLARTVLARLLRSKEFGTARLHSASSTALMGSHISCTPSATALALASQASSVAERRPYLSPAFQGRVATITPSVAERHPNRQPHPGFISARIVLRHRTQSAAARIRFGHTHYRFAPTPGAPSLITPSNLQW